MTSNPSFAGAVAMQPQREIVNAQRRAIVADAPTAILNLRGMNENSGCSVTCWRITSAQTRGSSISSGATPAH